MGKLVPTRSQFTTGRLWSVAQYNSNNCWLYNATNGTSNNNNKYNSNSGRALDYDIQGLSTDEDFLSFLDEFYEAYEICRKKKKGKSTTLEFGLNLSRTLIPLAISVWHQEYVPKQPIAFIITDPRIREVIAADFSDRVVQTWFALKLRSYLENDWFDDDSYSCREGRGGLAAVKKFQQYIYEETNGYVYDAWVVKRDIRAFFMSIDTAVLEDAMVDFIYQSFWYDENLRNLMCYLARIIYRGLPQNHCLIKNSPLSWSLLERRKSMFGKIIGLPIGNRTSQDAANFITTLYLRKLREKGYKFVHYTDDTAIVVKDLAQWKIDEAEIEKYISEELHLEWHPSKKYIQHFSKGVEFLGYKLRFDRIFPSDRIAHNFLWKTECAVRKSSESRSWMYTNATHVMQVFNSYAGLLKWCNANRLRMKGMEILINSPFNEVYNFNDGRKVTIKKGKTKKDYYHRINKERKANQQVILGG